jgi:fructose-1,6-bisphosphatase I
MKMQYGLLITVLLLSLTLTNSYRSLLLRPSLKCKSLDAKTFSKLCSAVQTTEEKSFKRFVQLELWRTPELESLYPVLCSVEQACRDIHYLMRRITSDKLDGYQRDKNGNQLVNIQGETQKKLDFIANKIMKVSLCCSGKINAIASEEEDTPCLCSDVIHSPTFSGGEYSAVFDPLDGSSNIDSGLPTGTIFGIYKSPNVSSNHNDPSNIVIQKANELVVAGYCLYSSSTYMVITMRTGVHIFSLDDVSGEFYLTHSNVRIPRSGNIYSFNEGNSMKWCNAINNFVRDLKSNQLVGSLSNNVRTSTGRYMGSLVADSHNILLNGGIFGYPATYLKPTGKIRLLYEANPIALIVEDAGGMAVDGCTRILDLPIKDIHQRTPVFLGSVDEVTSLMKYVKFYTRANH